MRMMPILVNINQSFRQGATNRVVGSFGPVPRMFFSDAPGLTDVITHSIHLVPGFQSKRLHAYRVPERLKPEVDLQIQEMLDNGIIRPSRSPMASPLVCVLKGKEGCDGVRLAVDYRYVNRFTRDDVYPLPDISSVF